MTAITVTVFPDLKASRCTVYNLDWDKVVERVRQPARYERKADCPLIKLARFGDQRSSDGSLRTDANMLVVSGIEGDYDGEEIPITEAAMLLHDKGVTAVLYTSPSHTLERPRWRVLCPLSKPYPPADRARLMARVNGALGGILSAESFALSQTFYLGQVNGSPYEVQQVRGNFVDLVDGLPEAYPQTSRRDNNGCDPTTDAELITAFAKGRGRREAGMKLAARYVGRGMAPDDALAALLALLRDHPDPDPRHQAELERELQRAVKSAAKKFGDKRAGSAQEGAKGGDGAAPRDEQGQGHESGAKGDPDAAKGTDEQKARDSVANKLVGIGEEAEMFHDDRRDGYAIVRNGDVRMTVRLRGRDYRRWLARQFWNRFGGAPNSDAIQTAINVIEAKAVFEGRTLTLANRFAFHDEVIYIDLADTKWRLVKVTAEGWEVLDTRPAMFRRYTHQRPLPEPERGGHLDELDGFVNLTSDDDRLLLRAWLTTAPLEHAPRPIVTLYGAQGSGKSTVGRVLRSLLDPSAVDNLSFPRKHDELAQVLDHHAVPNFDNLKTVDSASADMLCRAVTGGGFSKRGLFSDADDVIFSFRRPLLLNGINIPTHAPDLLDRMMLIELNRIPEDQRRTEGEFWAAFDAAHPRLFGALLDNMVLMLKTRPQAQNKLPRMADFAAWGARWAEGAGHGAATFLNAYGGNIGRQTEEAVEADDLALAVRTFVERQQKEWSGTLSDLLDALNRQRGDAPAPDGWPRKANSLGRKLRVLQTTLAQVGIGMVFEHSGGRRVALSKYPEKPSKPSISSKPAPMLALRLDGSWTVWSGLGETVQVSSKPEPAPVLALDDSDGLDGFGGNSQHDWEVL